MAELGGFKARGASVWLAAPVDSRIHQRAQVAGFPVRPLHAGKLRFPFAVLGLARWLRRQRVDILNPHSSRDAWLAGLAGRLAGVPLIIRSRHFDVPIRNPWMSRQVYCRLADHIITTSPRITEQLQSLFQLPAHRVSTIPTGIDLELFHPAGPRARLPEGAAVPGVPLIGMIGVLRRAKGHDVLLEAAARLRREGFNARYLFVGEGPMRELIGRKIHELGLDDWVTLTGEREDIPEVLRSLQLLVMPSLHEGIPQVGLQALASGTPVVASDIGGLPSIIRPGHTGRLVPSQDPAALASAIRQVFQEPDVTRRLSESGRQFVEKEHSLQRMLDLVESVYIRTLGGPRARHR